MLFTEDATYYADLVKIKNKLFKISGICYRQCH